MNKHKISYLITLGLWDQAMIQASERLPQFTVWRNDFDQVMVNWYDYNTHYRSHVFNEFSWMMWLEIGKAPDGI